MRLATDFDNSTLFLWKKGRISSRFALGTFFVCLIFLFKCISDNKKRESYNEGSKMIVENMFQDWKEGKADFFDLLADDVTWEVSGASPVSGRYKGKYDFLSRAVKPVSSALASRIKPELISISADNRYVWLHWKGQATSREGKVYENQYLWKLELRNNKIISAVAFLDTYALNELLHSN